MSKATQKQIEYSLKKLSRAFEVWNEPDPRELTNEEKDEVRRHKNFLLANSVRLLLRKTGYL